jgi:hypothetical protein
LTLHPSFRSLRALSLAVSVKYSSPSYTVARIEVNRSEFVGDHQLK